MPVDTKTVINILLALIVGIIISFAATPAAKWFANKVGAIDVPKDERRVHTHPIPRLGGLAIFVGFILSVVLFAEIDRPVQGILLGAVIVVISGVIDDIVPMRAWQKLIFQVLAAGIAVYHGVVIEILSNPFFLTTNEYIVLGALAIPITIIWIVGITNSVNIIDGLDGLAVGVSTISSIVMLVISILVSDGNVAIIMAALAGACIGFMPYNMNPAKIFMGDSGALLLGFVLSTASIIGLFKFYAIVSFAAPVLVVALPLFDTAFAFFRRILKGQSPMHADRGHLHHRLIDLGLSQKQAVAILYSISAVLGLIAVVLTTTGAMKAALLVATFIIAIIVAVFVTRTTHQAYEEYKKNGNGNGNGNSISIKKPEEKQLMKNKIRILSVFGTRPEAIKMAPLVLELQSRPEIESLCCVTAQHREMLDSVMDTFGLKADYDLDIMAPGQTLSDITARALKGLEDVFNDAKPDLVLVHGDTCTAFSTALAAYYAKIRVGHVEAGLRTYDKYFPFPEEMNRKLVASIADLHFCPTAKNAENLQKEGIYDGIFITGNTVIDAMKHTVRKENHFTDKRLEELDFSSEKVILMTCHRRENYGQPMEDIFTAVNELAQAFPDTRFVYPVHPSPAVRGAAYRLLGNTPQVLLTDPLDTVEMHTLMSRCYMVLTDSGGLQEEAPALGKPVLVLRRETERPEAVAAGTVRLAGVERDEVYKLVSQLLTDKETYERMARAVNPYGDGRASERIADALLWSFKLTTDRPGDFIPG